MTDARPDCVVISSDGGNGESLFQLHALFSVEGEGFALGQHLQKDKSKDAILAAWYRCRDLPYRRGRYDIIRFDRVLRPVRLAPDFSIDPLEIKSDAAQLKSPEVSRWFLHSDPFTPLTIRLATAPDRIQRAIAKYRARPPPVAVVEQENEDSATRPRSTSQA